MDLPWIEESTEGVLIRLLIQPRASRTGMVGLYGDPPRLKIRIAAPPVDGEANAELIAYLSKILRVPKSRLVLVRGQSGRSKEVRCVGFRADEIKSLLGI